MSQATEGELMQPGVASLTPSVCQTLQERGVQYSYRGRYQPRSALEAAFRAPSSCTSDQTTNVFLAAFQSIMPSKVEDESPSKPPDVPTDTQDEVADAAPVPAPVKPIDNESLDSDIGSLVNAAELDQCSADMLSSKQVRAAFHFKRFTKSNQQFAYVKRNMENLMPELPPPLKMTLYNEATLMLKSLLTEYERALAADHKLIQETRSVLDVLDKKTDHIRNI